MAKEILKLDFSLSYPEHLHPHYPLPGLKQKSFTSLCLISYFLAYVPELLLQMTLVAMP